MEQKSTLLLMFGMIVKPNDAIANGTNGPRGNSTEIYACSPDFLEWVPQAGHSPGRGSAKEILRPSRVQFVAKRIVSPQQVTRTCDPGHGI